MTLDARNLELHLIVLNYPEKWKLTEFAVAHVFGKKKLNQNRPGCCGDVLSFWLASLTIAKNEEEMDSMAKKDFSIAVDFDDDDFDPTLDLPGLVVVDVDGKRVRIDSIVENRLTVFFMVRNWGCVMGKYLASKILEKVEQFEEVGTQLIVIASGNPEAAQKWKKETAFPGSVFCDTDNVLVKTFSCKRGYKYLLSPRSLSSVQKAIADGFRPGTVDGEHTFLGGTLAYGKKAGIVFQHLERNLGDHVELDQVIQSVRRYQRDHPDRTWGPLSYLDLGIFHTEAIASSDGMVKPYHFERGDKSVANDDLPRLLDFAFYTRMYQNRDHSLWIRKLGDDYNVDISDDPYGAVVIALMKEQNGDYTSLVFSRVAVRRRVVFAYRDLNEKDCVKFLVNVEVVTAHSLLPISTQSTWANSSAVGDEKKELPIVKMRKTSNFTSIRAELIKWEAQERQVGYKFGILLAKPGETTEEEMYTSSSATTPLFESFLSILGDRVELAGYSGYTGGLDTKQGRTGTHSLATNIDETNIMFHVVSMIPATQSEGIIAKKRHIGNDMGVIIFKEGPEKIDVGAFRSQFNHFFIIVRPIPESDSITNNSSRSSSEASLASLASSIDSLSPRMVANTTIVNGTTVVATPTSTPTLKFSIEVVSKKGVPAAPPFLIENAHFELGPYMRQWIITKLLNLERMTQETVPTFRGKLEKVRAIAMWDVTLIANGKKAASETPVIPAPEPTAHVVVTQRRGSVLKKSGGIESPKASVGAVATTNNTNNGSVVGMIVIPTPNTTTMMTTIATPTSPTSGSTPASLPSPVGIGGGVVGASSLAAGGLPTPQTPTFPHLKEGVIAEKMASRKGSAPILPNGGGKADKEKVRVSEGPSEVIFTKPTKERKEKKDKDKDGSKSSKRLRSGSMIEDSSRINSSSTSPNKSGSSPSSGAPTAGFSHPTSPDMSDSESSASSTSLSSSMSIQKPLLNGGAVRHSSSGSSLVNSSDSTVRPHLSSISTTAATTTTVGPSTSSSTGSNLGVTSIPLSISFLPPIAELPVSPRGNVSPRPTRPTPAAPREASPRRTSTVIDGSALEPSGNPRPARAAPAPLSSRSLSTGFMPKLVNSGQTSNRSAAPSRAAPSPSVSSSKDSGSGSTSTSPNAKEPKEHSKSPTSKPTARPLPEIPAKKSTKERKEEASPEKQADPESPRENATSFSARAHQRKSSGYDSDKLAASLARQQELMAEGKTPHHVPQPMSETKVAHKAAFNSVKEKWKVIAADPAPSSSTSSTPEATPKRRLISAKSMSNLGHRSSSISSPTSKR
jgi:hypothetical protein